MDREVAKHEEQNVNDHDLEVHYEAAKKRFVQPVRRSNFKLYLVQCCCVGYRTHHVYCTTYSRYNNNRIPRVFCAFYVRRPVALLVFCVCADWCVLYPMLWTARPAAGRTGVVVRGFRVAVRNTCTTPARHLHDTCMAHARHRYDRKCSECDAVIQNIERLRRMLKERSKKYVSYEGGGVKKGGHRGGKSNTKMSGQGKRTGDRTGGRRVSTTRQ